MKPAVCDNPLGSVLVPAVIIFFGDVDNVMECLFSKFADDTNWSSAADGLEGRDVMQRELDRVESCAGAKLIKFNKVKCKVLHQGLGISKYKYRLVNEWIESHLAS